ncbi:MAG: hypothetical protein ACRCV9_19070 [Burkholderiaceae bacterium]
MTCWLPGMAAPFDLCRQFGFSLKQAMAYVNTTASEIAKQL